MTTKNTVSPVWCDARDDPLTTERENLPADRKTPSSLQRNSLHVWRGCVQWGLISTQVRSERKRPKESELKSCSCFITQRQVPRTAINYQPTSRRQSPLFPPRPQQLASIPVQTAVCQRLIYTRVFCVYVIFSSILILTQNNTNVSGWNGFCSWKGKIGHGVMRPQLRGTVRGAAGRQIKYWIKGCCSQGQNNSNGCFGCHRQPADKGPRHTSNVNNVTPSKAPAICDIIGYAWVGEVKCLASSQTSSASCAASFPSESHSMWLLQRAGTDYLKKKKKKTSKNWVTIAA